MDTTPEHSTSAARLWRHAEERPEALAVCDGRVSLSYRALCTEIDRLAALLSRYGVGPESRVLFLPDVCVESVIAYWALRTIDAVVIVGDPGSRTQERAHYIERTGASHALVGCRAAETDTPSAFCFHLAPGVAGVRQWGPERTEPPVPMAINDENGSRPAVILFSSGTTGQPKAIVHTAATIDALHRTLLATWRLSPADRVLAALPFHTIYGLLFSAGSALYAGAALVLLERFKPRDALLAIETHQVTTAAFVPAMALMILNLDDRDAFDLSSLRALYTASAPISEHDIARFEAYSGAPLISNYGLTEIPGAAVERADTLHHPGSVGQLSPGFEAVARDGNGMPLPSGKTGEITLRGPTLMAGYLDDPEQTARRVRDGWIYTQDIGHVDADGRVFLSGRMSDMIIRGGLNISPLEIEAVLSSHDAVSEAAVVGAPDRVLGQVVVACIVPSPAADRSTIFDTLMTHCRQFLSAPKVPVAIHLLDALPRNAGGKVLRKELAQRLEVQPADSQTMNRREMRP
ncbi:class I adenylate-forming enzyme family protein [Hoeflea poritis]|uniref:AMP-binding protein n=1 Tax=Hoeflea poritis TaxID=2993659 RepID=A0ABT4VI58_9HYPH|nr:AMP-binding protein [Hoeflea poritis]MDA4844392.1 AMP-binding protein [Hoeflea poritis]